MYHFLIQPFIEQPYLQLALVACLALSMACGPMGVFLLLRRMSLMGDALSHAILPGVAVAYLTCGMSAWAMMAGGLIAGLVLMILSGFIARTVQLKEDTSFAGLYLISLAAGVMILSQAGGDEELVHVLFGDMVAIKSVSLMVMASITSVTLLLLAIMYRGLVLECFDNKFLRSVGAKGSLFHMAFLVLLVLNLVGGFQALGTLMTLGLMILPALAAGFWIKDMEWQMGLASVIAFLSSITGLLIAYHLQVPSGSAIILVAGGFYLFSLLFGQVGSLRANYMPHHHLEG